MPKIKSKKNVKWHPCTVEGCGYESKQLGNLKSHLAYVHDIGKHTCDYCIKNRNSSIEFIDKNIGKVHICRECFNKQTGKNSRIELEWSDYLDKELGTEFLISSDKSLRSLGGCSLKRPDKLYASPELVELHECDENQHNYSMSEYSCEEQRITELYDDPSFIGKNMVVFRWNPHTYIYPPGIEKMNKIERLKLYVKLTKHVRFTQSKEQPKIFIYYMFYDKDNPKITKNIPHKLIYSEIDF